MGKRPRSQFCPAGLKCGGVNFAQYDDFKILGIDGFFFFFFVIELLLESKCVPHRFICSIFRAFALSALRHVHRRCL